MKNFSTLFLCGFVFIFGQLHSLSAHAGMEWESQLAPEKGAEADPETIEKEMQAKKGPVAKSAPLANPTFDEAKTGNVQVLTFRTPKDYQYEFSVLVEDGKITRTFLVSTAIAGKTAILGIHRLTPEKEKGLPFPWITSSTYDNSPMFWGINIRGGFFIHSTPHYKNLGKPASMGCVRASLPDAMEVFKAVTNSSTTSYSMIFEHLSLASGSPEAQYLQTLLKNSNMTDEDLRKALDLSHREIAAVSTGDLMFARGIPADAHARPFTHQQSDESEFPRCGGSDCWDVFKHRRAIVQLSPTAMEYSNSASISSPISSPNSSSTAN